MNAAATERHLPGATLAEWRAEVLRLYPVAYFTTTPTGIKHAGVGMRRVGKYIAPDNNHVKEPQQ